MCNTSPTSGTKEKTDEGVFGGKVSLLLKRPKKGLYWFLPLDMNA